MCVSGGRQPELLAAASVATHELVYATGGVDELALTGVEGMTLGAHLDADVLLGGTGLDHIAAGTGDLAIHIIGMDALFHGSFTSFWYMIL